MELKKILIEAFDENFSKSLGSIEAFINPDNYSRDVQIRLKDNPTINSSAATFSFLSVGEEKLTLGKIIVDGTGVVVSKPKPPLDTVEGYIKKFRSVVCDWNGDIHSTPYLKITWGSLVFNCICSSVSLKYTLFKPDGTPLRAEITLTLQSTVDPETNAKMAAQNSPDLTGSNTC